MSGKTTANGLSVLIPIYDFEVQALANSLLRQLRKLDIPFEILCYDDASPGDCKIANAKLAKIAALIYLELQQNMGRSKIRNRMAADAKYDKVLFLDCDSAIVKEDFIADYWVNHEAQVVYGGTVYLNELMDRSFILHHLAGKNREERKASIRQANPYHAITFNNIMLSRELLLNHPLDEELDGYGHEDTLFGMEMQQSNIPLLHIDNPVEHLGLERNERFIEKSRQAAKNLAHIYRNKGLGRDTGIVKSFELLRKLNAIAVFLSIYEKMEELILKNLSGHNPRLRFLDILKLAEFSREIKKGAK